MYSSNKIPVSYWQNFMIIVVSICIFLMISNKHLFICLLVIYLLFVCMYLFIPFIGFSHPAMAVTSLFLFKSLYVYLLCFFSIYFLWRNVR